VNDRTKFIGGSDIAAILGISPHRSAVDLWLDKTAPRAEETPTKATRRGSRLEPYIADMITSEFGLAILQRNQRYTDPEVPYFAAEIDAETFTESEGLQNIEIKTVHPFKAREWGDVETDQLPVHYVAQAQWGLGVTRRQACLVFALIGDDLRPYVVERDEETITAMRERATEFWERYVIARLRPPLDFAYAHTAETLRRLYPGTDGTTIEANDDLRAWRHVIESATERRDRYQATIDGARAHVLDAMGAAALLRFTDGKAFRRKLTQRKAYAVEATEYVDLRLVNMKGET
jgi:putative phage-type endonuclease